MTARFGIFDPCLFLLVFGCVFFFAPREVLAHAPHDEVIAILLSPAYAFDGTIFAILRYNIMRSTDFGHTWHRLTQGLGPYRFSALAISPIFVEDKCLFATSDGGGIFRSRDAGLSWAPINRGLSDTCLTCVTTSSTFDSDSRLIAIGQSGNLYTTNDTGDTWQRVFYEVTDLACASFIEDEIIVGTHTGIIYISKDNGRSWHEVVRLDPAQPITCITPLDPKTPRSCILVGTQQSGIFSLAQLDTQYQLQKVGLEGQHITALASTQNHHGTSVLFATTWRQAIFRSEDAGTTWVHYSAGLTTDRQADDVQFRSPHFKDIAISSNYASDQTLFLGGFDGVFKSTDGGQSWCEMRGALSIGLMVSFDLAPVNATHLQVACTTYVAGVYMRNAAGQWKVNNFGIEEGRLFDIAFSPNYASDQTLFTVSNWVLFRSTTGGNHWQGTPLVGSPGTLLGLKSLFYSAVRRVARVFMNWLSRDLLLYLKQYLGSRRARAGIPLPGFGAVLAISPAFQTDQTLFVGGRLGILRSRDGGATLQYVLGPALSPVRSLVVSPNFRQDGTIFVAFDDDIYRSIDRGSTWEIVCHDPALTLGKLAISPAYEQDQTIFLGSRSGLHRSRDGGFLWAPLHIDGLAGDTPVDGIAVSPCFQTDQELLVHVCGVGLFRSRDGGDTFAAVALPPIDSMSVGPAFSHMGQFPDRASLIKFSPHYNKDRTLFASSMEHLFTSSDGGNRWTVLKRPVRYENFRPDISYQGQWRLLKNSSFSSMSASCSTQPGDVVVFEFVGQEVRWIGMHGPKQGVANVMVDGQLVATVDQYADVPTFSQISFEVSDLAYGPHTLSVEATPATRHPFSSTAIIIDAFDVT